MANNTSGSANASLGFLKSIGETLSAKSGTQDNFDKVVQRISNEMVADVCSLYLRRNDGYMELYATEGLLPSAVHNTRLKPSEGLVGLVMDKLEPISLSDASSHPRFSYRPETGEDPYKSFLGVPMIKGGRTIGVLVVQNKVSKVYTEGEIEFLKVMGAYLTEIALANSSSNSFSGFDIKPTLPETLIGKTYSRGLVKGVVCLHDPEVAPTRLLAENIDAERERLQLALRSLQNGLDKLLTGEAHSLGAVSLEVLEMFSLLARDKGWEQKLMDGVKNGLTAEAAVEQVRSEHRAKMSTAKDVYLRDRLHDLEELDNRLLRHLAGTDNISNLTDNAVLIARDLGPAELLEYASKDLKAILLEEGSNTSHAAIIARAMSIPMIGQIKGLLARCANGDKIIIDGDIGASYLRYDKMIEDAFDSRFIAQMSEKERLDSLKNIDPITKDGVKIDLSLNAGLVMDLEGLERTGATSVGLFRTEFQFLVANSLPRVDAQTALYKRIMDKANGKPVTFRTLDLGGDKIARFMPDAKDENPAMGWRALRLGLDRPVVLSYQLRAILRATEGQYLRLMFPLVSTVSEFIAAKEILMKEIEWGEKMGRKPPAKIEVGAMIESPSIAWDIAELAKYADFFSIGTNDLMQFFYASDRGSAKLNDRYDILARPAFTFIKHIVDNAGDVPISICGEHAGRPLEVLSFIGLGIRRFSMPASAIGGIKEVILKIDHKNVINFTNNIIKEAYVDLRSHFNEYAKLNEIL